MHIGQARRVQQEDDAAQVQRVAAEQSLPDASVHEAHQQAVRERWEEECDGYEGMRVRDAEYHSKLAASMHSVQAADEQLAQTVYAAQFEDEASALHTKGHGEALSAKRQRRSSSQLKRVLESDDEFDAADEEACEAAVAAAEAQLGGSQRSLKEASSAFVDLTE